MTAIKSRRARFFVILGRKKFLFASVLLLGLLLFPGSSSTAQELETDLIFNGSGWGDGVGLSQYGARSLADSGVSAYEILGHYYPGTSIQKVDELFPESFVSTDSKPLWVGLLQNQVDVTFRLKTGSVQLCFDDPELCVAVANLEEKWKFAPDGTGLCAFSRLVVAGDEGWISTTPSGPCSGSVRPLVSSTTVNVPIKGRIYRDGILRFRTNPSSGRLHTALEIGIDDYIGGVRELPDFWPPAALRAQAIASRSLIVRHLLEQGPIEDFDVLLSSLCFCHIRDDDSVQFFGGHTAEKTHQAWSGVVGGTSGQVLTWDDEVIFAKFTSSSGGVTQENKNMGGEPFPYLIAVDDAAAHTSAASNPFTTWMTSINQQSLGGPFGFSWLNDFEIVSRYKSGSVATVRLSGIIAGRPSEILTTGKRVRETLGLYSPYFEVEVIPRFSDVSSAHPFAGEILGLDDLQITQGCTSTSFCPNGVVTRGEMAAFLSRALKLPDTAGSSSFSDDDNSGFEKEIAAIAEFGITQGCAPEQFCPSDYVTRGEMAAFLVRAFDFPASDGDFFDDDKDSVFEADIEALYKARVTNGCSLEQFCPSDYVTRGEMAAFLIRALAGS